MGFVIGIIGAILGTGVVYIIPALLNTSLLSFAKAPRDVWVKRANKALVGVGAIFAALGTLTALEEHFPSLALFKK